MKKRDKIIYWIATIWLSLGMVSTGIVQILKIREGNGGLDSMTHLGYPEYMLPLLGVLKLIGVAVLLIPGFPLLKEWAYAGFFFLITGALYSHFLSHDEAKEFFGAALLLVLIVVSWYFRPTGRKLIFNAQ